MKYQWHPYLVFVFCVCATTACEKENLSESRGEGMAIQDVAHHDEVESTDSHTSSPPAFSEVPADTRISIAQSCAATCTTFELTLEADGEVRYTAGSDSRRFQIDPDAVLEILNTFAAHDVMYLTEEPLASACNGSQKDTTLSIEMRVGGHSNALRRLSKDCSAPHPALVELVEKTQKRILERSD